MRWIVVLALVVTAPLAWASPQEQGPAWDGFDEAMEASDAESAIEEAERLIERDPRAPFARFALVRAHATGDDTERATEALRSALSQGFVDFHRLYRDPTLAAVANADIGVWLRKNWRTRQDQRSQAEAEALLGALGGRYRVVVDEALRVRLLTQLDEEELAIAREEIGRVARFASGLFSEADDARPDPWVLVLIPSAEDADRMLPQRNADGVYDHGRKALVLRDIGPALRHEFFHALHWRHMERSGRFHPIWIREGLATLVEDVDLQREDLVVRASWRTNIARRLARVGRLRPWDDFAAQTADRFTRTRPVINYAQSRAFMHWLYERSDLGTWFEAYDAGSHREPAGLASVEEVTGLVERDWQRELRSWLLEQPEVAVPGGRNPVGFGVALREGDGGVPIVDRSGLTSVDGVRLRMRDTVTAIEGTPVRTLNELYRELTGRDEGDTVRVTLDRRGETIEVTLRLVRDDTLGLR